MKRGLLLMILLACTVPAWAQSSAMTVSANLDELTRHAAVIVRGTVISARIEKHPELTNLDTVVVNMEVRDALKGQPGRTFTFRQYLWDIGAGKNAGGYQPGQDLLLMMIAPSRYGLSSPAGLEQGRFMISHDRSGREVAVNGRGNLKLFEGISTQVAAKGTPLSLRTASLVQKHVAGPVELRDLTALIRELAQAGP